MRFKMYLFLIFLLIVPFVFSEDLTCQYTDVVSYEVEKERWYLDDRLLEGDVQIDEATYSSDTAFYKVYNPFDFLINVSITYRLTSKWLSSNEGVLGTIEPESFSVLESYYDNSKNLDKLKMEIVAPAGLIKKLEKVLEGNITCKKCLGVDCINDGEKCSNPLECGGEFCIEGFCSDSEECFNNDCKCNTNEVQCNSNSCVKKEVIQADGKPTCNLAQECVTNYISPETGLCSKSPTQIENERKEEEKVLAKQKEIDDGIRAKIIKFLVTGISVILLIAILLVYLFFNKKKQFEEEKRKTILAGIYAEEKKIEIKEKEIQEFKKRLATLKKYNQEELKTKKKQIQKVNSMNKKIRREIQEVVSMKKKLRRENQKNIRVNEKKYGHKFKLENGYLKFVKSLKYPGQEGEFLHIWLYQKYKGNIKPGNQVHHIDGKKLNNDIGNLEQMSKEEHDNEHFGW
jgi:hypothetical protein